MLCICKIGCLLSSLSPKRTLYRRYCQWSSYDMLLRQGTWQPPSLPTSNSVGTLAHRGGHQGQGRPDRHHLELGSIIVSERPRSESRRNKSVGWLTSGIVNLSSSSTIAQAWSSSMFSHTPSEAMMRKTPRERYFGTGKSQYFWYQCECGVAMSLPCLLGQSHRVHGLRQAFPLHEGRRHPQFRLACYDYVSYLHLQ